MKLHEVITHLQYLEQSLGDVEVTRIDGESMSNWYKVHVNIDDPQNPYAWITFN